MKKVLLLLALVMSNFAQAQAPLHHFNFDGNYCNANSTSCFFQPNGNFFRNDRFTLPNNAIIVNPGVSSISGGAMANIPVGTNSRTISIWVKFVAPLNGNNNFYIFGYGGSSVNQGFNLTQEYNSANAGGQHRIFVSSHNTGVNVAANVFVQLDTWYHYVAILDNSFVKIYRDGQMIQNETVTGWNTTFANSGALRIGENTSGNAGSAMHIDDLSIYDRAISGTEVLQIYNRTVAISAPTISAVTSSVTSNSGRVNYSLNANNGATSSIIKYGLSSAVLSSQVNGFSATGNAVNASFATISGLQPSTLYYYQIEATNSAGTTLSAGNFTTVSQFAPITEYSFDSTYNNINGDTPFSNVVGVTSFVADRNSQSSSAVRIGSTTVPSTATIASLPVGNTERTISFWHKKPAHTVPIGLFAYGTSGSLQTFGVYLLGNGNYVFQGSVTDITFPSSATSANTWINTIITYKNGVIKLYNNGVFVASANLTLNTGSSAFRLGGNQAIVEFDDLKVYNYELSAAQVGGVFNSNTLSSSHFSKNNLKVALYPNPVNDVLYIETETEIKSVAIYNLLGQKVKTAKSRNINVADLSNGTYMVRVQDTKNAVETMKIVKQ